MASGAQAFLPAPPAGVAPLPRWLQSLNEGLLHPTPTAGFRSRILTLFTLSTLYTIIAAAYGIVNIVRTEERPRRKAFWVSRLVSRSSGRFIVLNPRLAWSFGGIILGLWSICLVWYNYQAFIQQGDQASMWGIRAMNNWVWFVVAWPCSWAGAQAFLLTSDAPNSRLPSATKANLLFLIVGFLLAAMSFTTGMYQSVRGERYWFAGGALRDALINMTQSSTTGSPSEEQMAVLVPLANKTQEAWVALKTATIIHASFTPIPVLACLIVNAGGCALVRKLHHQVRESTSLHAPSKLISDDPADWRGPSPASSPMSKFGGSEEKLSTLPPSIIPPTFSHSSSVQGDRQLTTLQNLKRAEIDMAALTALFIISTLAFTAGTIMADTMMSVDVATWSLAEGAFGAPLWTTVIVGPLIYAFLLFNAISDRLVAPTGTTSYNSTRLHLPPMSSSSKAGNQPARTTSKLAQYVPVLARLNSSTPMMSDHSSAPRAIKVTVQVRTDEFDYGKD